MRFLKSFLEEAERRNTTPKELTKLTQPPFSEETTENNELPKLTKPSCVSYGGTKGVGISPADVLDMWTDANVVRAKPIFCHHCDGHLVAQYDALFASSEPVAKIAELLAKRRGDIFERIRPNGRREWACRLCGRRAVSHNNVTNAVAQ